MYWAEFFSGGNENGWHLNKTWWDMEASGANLSNHHYRVLIQSQTVWFEMAHASWADQHEWLFSQQVCYIGIIILRTQIGNVIERIADWKRWGYCISFHISWAEQHTFYSFYDMKVLKPVAVKVVSQGCRRHLSIMTEMGTLIWPQIVYLLLNTWPDGDGY